MKYLLFIITLLSINPGSAQYYLRGEVRDEKQRNLPNVKIFLKSKGSYPFSSGNSGMFGIPTSVLHDSITLMLDGYEPVKTAVNSNKYQVIVMKPLPAMASFNRFNLASQTKNLLTSERINFNLYGESYNETLENSFVKAENFPETGFALNFDRASYSNIRRMLNMDYKVPPDAVRIEELLNYFNFPEIKTDTSHNDFLFSGKIVRAPWNKNNELLFLKLQAPKVDLNKVPPTSFTFLIDVSGSMDRENRLPLIKSAFKLLVKHLRAIDTVSIVVYGGYVGVALPPTSGEEKDKINAVIDELDASGDTPGAAAIKTAYKIASRAFIKNGNNRIILATDGDFNVGQRSEQELEYLITQHRKSGIFLTCLGVGMGNYKDSKLQTLAKKGNGNFAYLDKLAEAEKVLVTEFTQTMYSVASDAFLNIKFNESMVDQYRLIGFDNKIEAMSDTSSILEGGEIGSGQTIIALFEIVPKIINENKDESLAVINLHYKCPAGSAKTFHQQWNIGGKLIEFLQADEEVKLATALTMFGLLLKQSEYAKAYNWDDVLFILNQLSSHENVLVNELKDLSLKAKKIYSTGRWKKERPLLFNTGN